MSEHRTTRKTDLLVPLEDFEFDALKKGGLVEKVFHPEWSEHHSLAVFIGQQVPKQTSHRSRSLLRQGYDLAPWPLTKELIEELETGDKVPCRIYNGFTVTVVLKGRLEANQVKVE